MSQLADEYAELKGLNIHLFDISIKEYNSNFAWCCWALANAVYQYDNYKESGGQ
jgi:hypothetical protein